MALYVGRGNNQSRPKEDGWVWFTLDMLRDENFDSSRHLQMDFNDPQMMQKIHRHFDKVVTDSGGVIKFMESPWDQLHPLLFDRTSELIAEGDRGSFGYGEIEFDGRTVQMLIPYMNADDPAYAKYKKNCYAAFHNEIGKYLKGLFHHVEFRRGAYPYCEDPDEQSYWVLHEPK